MAEQQSIIQQNKLIISVALILMSVIGFVSFQGMHNPKTYCHESQVWRLQCIVQDQLNIFLVIPVLVFSGVLIYYKKYAGYFFMTGVLSYLIYTFVIYCFNVHFNKLFVLYCLALGISSFLATYLFYKLVRNVNMKKISSWLNKLTGIYFIVVSTLFYLLWLLEIIPATFSGSTLISIKQAGLFTNPVHVIDLSFCLPAIFISGILILRKNLVGIVAGPVLLTFFILMDITIMVLSIMSNNAQAQASLIIELVMAVLALASSILLFFNLKYLQTEQL